jgi:predicted outer membrane repeat protein
MNQINHHLSPGIVLLVLGLFLAAALALTNSTPTYADPGVRYAAPAVQGSGDCSSWDNACTLQTALTGAVSGDEIWVKKGVHYPGTARTHSFRIQRNNVQLYGGFAGTETARSQRNWVVNSTVLSGDIGTSGDIADNSYHVLYVDGVTIENITGATVIDGFTVTAGHANSSTWPHYLGGGLFCAGNGLGKACSPTLTDIIFDSNKANYGGGMYSVGAYGGLSSPILTNVVLSNNLASYSGGGMYNSGYQGVSSPTLTNVTFIRNTASGNGGGMYNDGYEANGVSSPTLRNVTFTGNQANSAGGMYNYGSYSGHSSPTLTNVLFGGNRGGGMVNSGSQGVSSPTLMNVTFSGNQADQGGGMRNYAGPGGVSTPTLRNCILWGNAANTDPQIQNQINAVPTISYSLIGGSGGSGSGWNAALGVDGGNNLDIDPRFVGSVAASAAPTTAGNYRLGFGSPAIDSGVNAGCPVNDRDGNPRPNDGDGDEVVVCDMGAYEAGTMVAVEPVEPGDPPYEFPGQPGVSIEILDLGGRANGELAYLYVDGMGIDHPHATGEMTTGQYWLIRGLQADGATDASGFLATLTLPHNLPDHTAAHACRFLGESSWDCARSSSDAGSVVRADVTQFSDWTVSDGMPLAVTLSSFTAQVQEDYVLVAWETLSEVDTLGFNLWRGLAADGSDREVLTFVPAQSPGSTQGAVYQVQDAAVQAGTTYWYWLEDIDLGGQTTLHGPVSATMLAPTAVTLAELASSPTSRTATPVTAAAVALVAGLALWVGLRRQPMTQR